MDLKILKNIKEKSPYVMILIGPPLSGKGTFVKEFKENIDNDVVSINRDEIVMEVYGSRNYNEAFDNVNQKEVDQILDQKMRKANSEKKNVIVDMTHMGSKRRRMNLGYFSNDYYKLGVIFPILTDEEYDKRNKKRTQEEKKDISMAIVKRMIASYQSIRPEEGFDKVISI
jgi:predicted kinase